MSVAKPDNHHTSRRGYAKERLAWWSRYFVPALIIAVAFIVMMITILVTGEQRPKADSYQVVVLDNGQVYFGHLKNVGADYLRLEDAYYAKNQTLPDDASSEQIEATANNIALTKVGGEVYGPENTLMIKSERVVFWQDLRSNSKVVQAIEQQS